MGYGDEIIASGLARGAKARGKRVAFGNGQLILWHNRAHDIFQNNPNVAPPGCEGAPDLEWIANHVGNRSYNVHNKAKKKWDWTPHTITQPGEIFFSKQELEFAHRVCPTKRPFVLIEPNVPTFKLAMQVNKQWPFERYQAVVNRLKADGLEIVQLVYGPPYGPGKTLGGGVHHVGSPNFRMGMAVLSLAKLYVGSEGGMHHAAAALGIPATVIFGGFVSPEVTGYAFQENHFIADAGRPYGCGSLDPCNHCVQAMHRIKAEDVYESCVRQLKRS